MNQRDSEEQRRQVSAPSQFQLCCVLASLLASTLWWPGTSQAREVTPVTSLAELTAACDPDDFAVEDFEGLVGDEIDASSANFAIGFPETLFAFDSGLVLGGPDPNFKLLIIDLGEGTIRYSLGTNGDIAVRFECNGGANHGDACADDDACPAEDPTPEAPTPEAGICERINPDLPSGVAYAATDTRDVDPISFLLPPSDSACSAVGMFISSFDGDLEGTGVVTLTLFDRAGSMIGAPETFQTEAPLVGFIGIVGPPSSSVGSVEISSDEDFAFDDLWHPVPEPASMVLELSALVALAAITRRRSRDYNPSSQ